MASAWRIVLSSEAAQAFSGEGSRRYGGRWNSPGVRAVYASEHQSTAALEIFIHSQPFLPDKGYKAFYLEWPDRIAEVFVAKNLPADWRIIPPPRSTMEIGDQWVLEERSAVLAVPSAITPVERNFLLNPAHRDFDQIRIARPIDFTFDPRLIGR
jgi:RES domain-containing protein